MENVELLGNAEETPISENNDNVEAQSGATEDQEQGGDSYVPEIEVPEGDTSAEDTDQDAPKTGEPKPAKEDETRFQYWQSQADQYKRQLELERQQYQEQAAYAPIAKYLQENPQLLNVLERELQSGHPAQEAPAQGQQAQQTSLERPEKPLKPRNYDPNETDPESESYKYRLSMAEYNDNLLEYMVARDEHRESQMAEQRRIAEQEQAKQTQMSQLAQTLKVEHGFDDYKAQDFMRTMMDPSSVTLENLIALYEQRLNAQKGGGAEARQKAQEILKRQGRKVPLPAGVGGVNTPNYSDEDVFNASLSAIGR
jgi:hypothetical protein